MPEKNFQVMSLDEIYDLDAETSPNLGRSVVSTEGIARHSKQLAELIRDLGREIAADKNSAPAQPKTV